MKEKNKLFYYFCSWVLIMCALRAEKSSALEPAAMMLVTWKNQCGGGGEEKLRLY